MWEAVISLLLGMNNMICWNIRGLSGPNKQNEVNILCNKERVGLIRLVETKIKVGKIKEIARKMFGGWEFITNLQHHYNGRIWLTWRPDVFQVVEESSSAQAVTFWVIHNGVRIPFILTVVYAFNTSEDMKDL